MCGVKFRGTYVTWSADGDKSFHYISSVSGSGGSHRPTRTNVTEQKLPWADVPLFTSTPTKTNTWMHFFARRGVPKFSAKKLIKTILRKCEESGEKGRLFSVSAKWYRCLTYGIVVQHHSYFTSILLTFWFKIILLSKCYEEAFAAERKKSASVIRHKKACREISCTAALSYLLLHLFS